MAYFRPVYVRQSRIVDNPHWEVERTALGQRGRNLPQAYSSHAEARTEAKKLNALEPKTIQKQGLLAAE